MSDVYLIVQDGGATFVVPSADGGETVIIRQDGAAGAAAGQDIGWGPLTAPFAAGEKLNSPPLAHAATYSKIYAHSDAGVASTQILTVNQIRAGSIVATDTLSLTSGAHDWSAMLVTPIAGAVADILQLVLPNPADAQMTDLSISLGSA